MTVFTKISGLLLPTKDKAGFILRSIPGATILPGVGAWTPQQKTSVVAITQQNIYDTAYLLANMVEVESMLNGASTVVMLYVPNAQQIINK
jgi:hypothetical protein